LMVREVVLRGLPRTWLLIDDSAAAGPPAERALAIAASVATRLLRTGHTVELMPVAGQATGGRVEPAAGQAPLLEAFARIRLGQSPQESGTEADLRLSNRLLAQIGSRGAVAPIYGAFVEVDPELAAELARLAGLARPGQLWLTGPDKATQQAARALRGQGWTVIQDRP
jgi:uncharacterized protein (DUF58 family)